MAVASKKISINQKVNSDYTPNVHELQYPAETEILRYNRCAEKHKNEKDNFWTPQRLLYDSRTLPKSDAHNFSQNMLRNPLFCTAYPSAIFGACANAMTNFVAPLKENGISITVDQEILDTQDRDGKMAKSLARYSRHISDIFHSPKAGINRNFAASIFNEYAYGNCANLSAFDGGNYRCVSLNFQDLAIDTDESTNEVTCIYRKRFVRQQKRVVVDVWKRREGTTPDNIAIGADKKSPYIYQVWDEFFKDILEEYNLNYMPVTYGRLKVIPGHSYGKGYGEDLRPEAQDLHSFVAKYGIAALMALDPPKIFNSLGVKSKKEIDKLIKTPGALIHLDQSVPMQDVLLPVVNFNINEINAFAPYWQQMQATIELTALYKYGILPEHVSMTDMQVAQRVEEKVNMLSGVVAGMIDDLVMPVLNGLLIKAIETDALASGAGFDPDRRSDWEELGLSGIATNIQIKTGFDSARDFVKAQNNLRAIQFVMGMAPAMPNVMDNFDMDALIRETTVLLGADPSMLRNPAIVEEMREQRAAQQADAQQQQAFAAAAAAAGKSGAQ